MATSMLLLFDSPALRAVQTSLTMLVVFHGCYGRGVGENRTCTCLQAMLHPTLRGEIRVRRVGERRGAAAELMTSP